MPFMTVSEFYATPIYALDEGNYRRIERAFRRVLGDKAKRFLESHMLLTTAQLSTASAVDVMSAIRVL